MSFLPHATLTWGFFFYLLKKGLDKHNKICYNVLVRSKENGMNLRIVYYDKDGEVKNKFLSSEATTREEQEKAAKDYVAGVGGKYVTVQILA